MIGRLLWPFRRRAAAAMPRIPWLAIFHSAEPPTPSPEAQQSRAVHAQRLLDDALFREAWDAVATEYATAWCRTAESQAREREQLWLMLGILRKVRSHFETAVRDGKVVDQRQATAARERARMHPIR